MFPDLTKAIMARYFASKRSWSGAFWLTAALLGWASLAWGNGVPLGFSVLGTTVPPEYDPPTTTGFTEQLPDTNMTPPTWTAGEISQGYAVFATNYEDRIYPYTLPLREEITDQFQMFSVRGEYEPVTFALHALSHLQSVLVWASDLTGPGGTISSTNIDVRTVRCWPRRVWNQPKYILQPSMLEKRTTVDVDADRTQQYWITVYVPATAAAGTYTGTITIQAVGRPNKTLQLALEVSGIELADPDTYHGMYYMPRDLSQPGIPEFPYDRLYNDIMNMKEHGMDTFHISHPPTCSAYTEFGQVWFDVSPLDTLRDLALLAGFPTVVFNTSIDEIVQNPLGGFGTMVRGYVLSLNNAGWPTIISSIGDESDANGSYGNVYSLLNQFRTVLPDELNYTTIVFPENSEWYEPYLDIRAFSSYIDEVAKINTQAAGRQLWEYSGAAGYGLDPKGDRFYRGVWTLVFGFKGALQWTYFRPVLDPSQPFNDLIQASARNNMTAWCLPADDGPLPSPGWEAMREGIEDQRYGITLAQKIAEVQQFSGNVYLAALADQAQQWVDGMYAQVDISPRDNDSQFVISREVNKLPLDYSDTFRQGAAQWIVRLQDALAQLYSDGAYLPGAAIEIDGVMGDWTSAMLVGTDPDDPAGWYPNGDEEDLQHFYLANDGSYLYGRFTTVAVPNDRQIWFALDTDDDPCTGSHFEFDTGCGQNGCEVVVSMLLGFDVYSDPCYPDDAGGGGRHAFVDIADGVGGWLQQSPAPDWHRNDRDDVLLTGTGSEFRVPLGTLGIAGDTVIRWSAGCASSDVFAGDACSQPGPLVSQEYVLTLPGPRNCAEVYQAGLGVPTDLNQDCRVNLVDFALIANDWPRCNNPEDENCENPYQ